ncbi:Uncharacterised protein [Mycobacteroides abscessus subsp. massiliense]|nr:Uncharacterised protein [Mycobacteroides abscessus subsp. massiliense]
MVRIGAFSRSASAVMAAMSNFAPAPTTITGRVADSMRRSAVSSAAVGGPTRRSGMRPCGPVAGSSGAGSTDTAIQDGVLERHRHQFGVVGARPHHRRIHGHVGEGRQQIDVLEGALTGHR